MLPASFADEYPGWFPVSALLVVEAIDPESGEPNLITLIDEDNTAWKALGMAQSFVIDRDESLRTPADE